MVKQTKESPREGGGLIQGYAKVARDKVSGPLVMKGAEESKTRSSARDLAGVESPKPWLGPGRSPPEVRQDSRREGVSGNGPGSPVAWAKGPGAATPLLVAWVQGG